MKILVLNSGSSSQKSCVYELDGAAGTEPANAFWQGKIEWEGANSAQIAIRNASGVQIEDHIHVKSRGEAIEQLLETIWKGRARVLESPAEIDVVGHRIVHGGEAFREATHLTPEVKTAIAELSTIAPLHNRAELQGMEIVERKIGPVLQVGVFDTAFHRRMPEAAAVYPGPYDWLSLGIRRYGFHGINHQYCAEQAAHLLGKDLRSLRIVTCHLGNGCSLAAIRDGRSVETTMGFTPLEGLMMGTRSGSIDPAILTYLMREKGYTGKQLEDLLNKESGLLGISGVSSDMRRIVAAMKEGHERAKLAFEMFVHRLRLHIGAMCAALGGIDALVFTGGIGENSVEVRESCCEGLEFLGMKLDGGRNRATRGDGEISAEDSGVRVLVIRAQEDWAIARECWKLASREHGRQSAV
jgi:acetate kinase